MGASSRPGGRPRRPGPSDQIRATGTRHRRYVKRRAPDPGPRAAWAFAVIALVAGVGMIVFIAFEGSGRRIAVGPSATPVVTSAPVPSPSPTDALAITGDGPGGPVASPVRTPVTRVTPEPTPASSPRGNTGEGTLQVEFPQDGEVVVSGRINVFGRAPGGARVLRLLPDGSIDTTAARPDGLWILGVDLEPGENELRFRAEGSEADPVVVRVTWQPR